MPSKLHVLVLPSWYPTTNFPLNGTFFREQARVMQRNGVEVGVAYASFRSLRQITFSAPAENHFQTTVAEEAGLFTVRYHGWNPGISRIRGKLARRQFLRLVQLYIKHRGTPDIVHAHSTLWAGVAAREIREQLDIPYVVTEHSSAFLLGALEPWQEDHVKHALRDANAICAVSPALAEVLEEYAPGRRIHAHPNLVDTSYFELPPVPRNRHAMRFLCVAFLTQNKGVDLLLRAFAQNYKNIPNAHLEIVGDGPVRPQLEALAKMLGIVEQVTFRGSIAREEVREAMWRSNVLVLPSYRETFGVVLVEALATGMPVVATTSGGPERIVTPSVGYLVPTGDYHSLGDAMASAIRLGATAGFEASARTHAEESFGVDSFMQRLRATYREVLE